MFHYNQSYRQVYEKTVKNKIFKVEIMVNKAIITVIIGGGSHAHVVLDNLKLKQVTVLGYLSLDATSLSEKIKYLGNDSWLEKNIAKKVSFIMGFNFYDFQTQKKYKIFLSKHKNKLLFSNPVVHHKAIVDKTTELDNGTLVCSGAIIGRNTKVGKNCLINSGAIIEHDCIVKSGTHIAPGAILCGGVKIEKFSLIGAGSVIINNSVVPENTIVKAGQTFFKAKPLN
jgi:sugar O-acyltransferase (sialic acid O-acetyltransferase NeuD family)